MQTLTQHEKDFVVEFLADILHGLTINNVLSRQEGDCFVRMQDAQEVMENLKMLYNKHMEEDGDWELNNFKAEWTFTLEDARDALTNYDTEYREGICEQFEGACEDALEDEHKKKLDADYTTLHERVTGY